jgi:hypothetical protein
MRRKIVPRGFVALSLAAVSVFSALPGTAGAAIQLGQVSPETPPSPCNVGNYIQVSRGTAVYPYTVPSPGGVITRWSHRGIFLKQPAPPGTPRAGSGRLQVWDFQSGPLFGLLARSEVETFTGGVEATYLTRIPVGAGDLVGMRAEARTGCRYVGGGIDSLTRWETSVTDPAPGQARFFLDHAEDSLLNLSAVLEPDADADGFGDETQDGCPGQAGPAENSGCPPGTAPPPGDGGPGDGGPGDGGPGDGGGTPSNEFSFGKVKKNKRKGTAKLTVEVPGPGDLALTETDKVKGSLKQADAAGDEKLAIKPTSKAKRKLNRKGKAKVDAEVTYTPELGASNTDSKSVKLKKR